jgi:uncharacterized protein
MNNRRRLSAVWVVVGVLAFTVVTSFAVVGIAVVHGDPPLPEQYHWEGWQVDRDFGRSQRAVDLDVIAHVDAPPAASTCSVRLSMIGAQPQALVLNIVHASKPELDQRLKLKRAGEVYEAPCDSVMAAQWLLELTDAANTWSVRSRASGQLIATRVAARPSEGLK